MTHILIAVAVFFPIAALIFREILDQSREKPPLFRINGVDPEDQKTRDRAYKIYMIDWLHAKEHGKQASNIQWYFGDGPRPKEGSVPILEEAFKNSPDTVLPLIEYVVKEAKRSGGCAVIDTVWRSYPLTYGRKYEDIDLEDYAKRFHQSRPRT